ncbi:uncharacterized protein [Aegilops tauschii subsp. strangulata]|uniref:uncharacterized protein n=1 Tax=Aegilops tauschii subsp. strangulata TaxID=200361 RepID=UPI003CC88041
MIASFSITVRVEIIGSGEFFWMTSVYGPSEDEQKENFLTELASAAPPPSEPWMLNGDFNMIYQARDKNNGPINRRMMVRFRRAIDLAGVREVKCRNRRFTWSSERESPTLCSIDKTFCNLAWEDMFPDVMLTAASTSFSDHCPLLLANGAPPIRKARFRFEKIWPRFPHFQETVQHAWDRPVNHDCPFIRISRKLQRVAADLKIWSRSLFGGAKLQFHIANAVILQLDMAQEARNLTEQEWLLCKQLKLKVLGFAALERARKRQASRIMWLKSGDANSKFFHAKIRARRRKNYIHSIKVGNAEITEHHEKASAARDHFTESIGRLRQRSCTLNWEELHLREIDMSGFDLPFTEPEVWAAVLASPAEKAPGPDGFTGRFFRACWSTVKYDIMEVFQKFYNLAGVNLKEINTAFIDCYQKRTGQRSCVISGPSASFTPSQSSLQRCYLCGCVEW